MSEAIYNLNGLLPHMLANLGSDQLFVQIPIPSQISFTTTLPVVPFGVVRVRFLSSMSVHTFSRFLLHYNTVPPASSPCDGLTVGPDEVPWHHVAATVDQVNSSASSVNLFVDGNLRVNKVVSRKEMVDTPMALVGRLGLAIGRSDPGRPPPLIGPYTPSNDVYNGEFDVRQGQDMFWAAGLDELRLWNVSRSAEEINLGMRTACRSGMGGVLPILCYSFDALDLRKEGGNVYFTDLGLAPPAFAQAVVGDRFAPWCTTLGDNGLLVDKVLITSYNVQVYARIKSASADIKKYISCTQRRKCADLLRFVVK